MKKMDPLFFITIFLVMLCFITVFLATREGLSGWDLSSARTANIGSAIGGITAPLLSIFSSYLLYMALTAQQEGNKYQQAKGDSDIIFILLSQLDKEYDSFSLVQKTGNFEKEFRGFRALVAYCIIFIDHKGEPDLFKTFKISSETVKIMYMIRSIDLIRARIQHSKFETKTESMLSRQLDVYYQTKFKFPISILVDSFENILDPLIDELKKFQRDNDRLDY